jgi:hypothetical protein
MTHLVNAFYSTQLNRPQDDYDLHWEWFAKLNSNIPLQRYLRDLSHLIFRTLFAGTGVLDDAPRAMRAEYIMIVISELTIREQMEYSIERRFGLLGAGMLYLAGNEPWLYLVQSR